MAIRNAGREEGLSPVLPQEFRQRVLVHPVGDVLRLVDPDVAENPGPGFQPDRDEPDLYASGCEDYGAVTNLRDVIPVCPDISFLFLVEILVIAVEILDALLQRFIGSLCPIYYLVQIICGDGIKFPAGYSFQV